MQNNILITLLALLIVSPAHSQGAELPGTFKRLLGDNEYICPPCYHTDESQAVYQQDGRCPICDMALIENPDHPWKSEINLHAGSGNFTLAEGSAIGGKPVTVFYHQPKKFDSQSPILLVIPGAGRNGWSYRDSWIAVSEQHNVLILSPAYAEQDYDFANYHMGGVIQDLQLKNVKTTGDPRSPSKYHLNDEDIIFTINQDSDSWLFNDFDRIFSTVVTATGSDQTQYNLFGHSAGGQILHRLAIFKPDSRANVIIAANSGQFTLPSSSLNPPFGVRGVHPAAIDLPAALAANLVVMVGELDDQNETHGTMLHTPIADQQGLGRLERATYFYRFSKQTANELNVPFNWRLRVVKGVGHDQAKMAAAAAEYLYGELE